jgi:hypothetical protein
MYTVQSSGTKSVAVVGLCVTPPLTMQPSAVPCKDDFRGGWGG